MEIETKTAYYEEYKEYLTAFTELKKDLISQSGDIISERMMQLEGYSFRLGQIIADLDAEHVDYYLAVKESEKFTTDKQAEHLADLGIRSKYTVSLKHFVNMNKSFQAVIQSFKKRLKQLEWERYNQL